MAKEEHVALLQQGVMAWNKWREENPSVVPDLRDGSLYYADLIGANLGKADLRGADLVSADLIGALLRKANLRNADLSNTDLHGADLDGADLRGARLRKSNLGGADLVDANLRDVDFRGARLRNADLRGAVLRGADLRGATFRKANLGRADLRNADLRGAVLHAVNFSDADLRDTDFRQAVLIDSCLDRTILSGAKLWESQRGGWSIKDIVCQWAFWDRAGEEPTKYENGDFERIFAEKLRIVLRFPGGISLADLAMLPLIVERLQSEHPDCALHIRSVQDDGSGATMTITVDDRTGRQDGTFNKELVLLQAKLECVLEERDHLRQRLGSIMSEAISTIQDLTKLPTQEIHVHRPSGLITIEGTTMSRDTYNIQGQAGAVGPKAHAHDMTFQQAQNQSGLDLPRLAGELVRLHAAMKQETAGTREQDKAIVAVADAEEAAAKGDGPTALRHLKAVGQWTLGVAEKIGVAVAAEAIKRAM